MFMDHRKIYFEILLILVNSIYILYKFNIFIHYKGITITVKKIDCSLWTKSQNVKLQNI